MAKSLPRKVKVGFSFALGSQPLQSIEIYWNPSLISGERVKYASHWSKLWKNLTNMRSVSNGTWLNIKFSLGMESDKYEMCVEYQIVAEYQIGFGMEWRNAQIYKGWWNSYKDCCIMKMYINQKGDIDSSAVSVFVLFYLSLTIRNKNQINLDCKTS